MPGAKELCHKHGGGDAFFDEWRFKFGDIKVSDAKRLKVLEAENIELKKLLTQRRVDVSAG